jgi:uncharacterized cupredoxin-like copper-binding protein
MTGGTRTAGYAVSVVAAFAVALASCGGPSGSGQASASGSHRGAPEVVTVVNVVEKEFSITMPKEARRPGTYTFRVSNQGTSPHSLTVKGPGVDATGSSTISPGHSGDLTVRLQTGSYEFWCSVDSHKERGMDLIVKVG